MTIKNNKESKDAVTVGQIRKRMERQLDNDINTLNNLIRQGYFKLPEAEKHLKEVIANTLTRLQNLDAMASTEVLFPEQ
jgi:hypothetical protein